MSNTAVARRYAQALVDLCDEANNHTAARGDFDRIAQVCADVPEALTLLANPTVPEADREKLLADILTRCKVEGHVANFTKLLLERGRFDALGDIHARFSELLDARTGRVVAHVTSATPLADAKLAEIKAMLAGAQKREVSVEYAVDADLVGGIVIRVGNTVYDGSVRNHFERLRERMTVGAGA